MLEVGTGVVWWLKIRTTCFCVLWRHQNYNFLCTELYRTAALSHSQALCACLCMFMCLDVRIWSQRSSLALYSFSFNNYSMAENGLNIIVLSTKCPTSQSNHFEHEQGNLIDNFFQNNMYKKIKLQILTLLYQQWIKALHNLKGFALSNEPTQHYHPIYEVSLSSFKHISSILFFTDPSFTVLIQSHCLHQSCFKLWATKLWFTTVD